MKEWIFAAALLAAFPVMADETPPHAIAVAGEAETWLVPDYATIDVGVITQGSLVSDALSDNSARMSRVIEALRSLGIADRDIHTADFDIEPKYEKQDPNDYTDDTMRAIVGYRVANRVTVTVTDMSRIAKIIDTTVQAGANASGRISFHVHDLPLYLDKVREAAIADARHKAEVLTRAAHTRLGPVLSIADNAADLSYNGHVDGTRDIDDGEVVVVTGSRIPPPILPGRISASSRVTVLYTTR
ncbi:MAG TPA: SIMPL domain-containing protein [Rhizomicrobium sp.]|nr:SIMPL domain-containing protein [Rhizomicrobium sp.]